MSNEPDYRAVAFKTSRAVVARLTAKAEHTALTFGESRQLRNARRNLTLAR